MRRPQQTCTLPQLRHGFPDALSRGHWRQLERHYEGIPVSLVLFLNAALGEIWVDI